MIPGIDKCCGQEPSGNEMVIGDAIQIEKWVSDSQWDNANKLSSVHYLNHQDL